MNQREALFVAGKQFQPGREIGGGAEGAVHEIPLWPGYLAKLYAPHLLSDSRRIAVLEAKLQAQLKITALAREPWLAWPLEIVRDGAGRLRGLVMKRMEGMLLQRLMAPVSVSTHLPNWTHRHLLRVCHDLALHQQVLESHGVWVADMGTGNFLIDPADGAVRFIDSDSYQIGSGPNAFACEVLAPHFSSPEVLNRGTPGVRAPEEVRFAAALLFFSVLTLGASAFMQMGGSSVPENIRAGRIAIGGTNASAFMPPTYYARYARQSPWVKKLFNDTLRRGHSDLSQRVGFDEWRRAFAHSLNAPDASLNTP